MVREIKLGGKVAKGRVALVDDDDFALLNNLNWWCDSNGYAKTKIWKDGELKQIPMHRFLLESPIGIVDHVNRNRLDNRRENLRVSDRSGNAWNKKKMPTSPHKYKGVGIERRGKKLRYKARVAVYNERISLGAYSTEEEAAKAYNVGASHFQGEFALLNDVDHSNFVIDISGPSVVFDKIVSNAMYRSLFDAGLLSINGITKENYTKSA